MDKKVLITGVIIILIIVVAGVYFLLQNNSPSNNYEMIQGMKVEILKQGTGAQAKTGDTVTVNYVGALENGIKFDSSIDRETPFPFTLGENRVIKGWELGVLGMRAGEKRKLTIPPELGYGSAGAGGVIPPNATLIFEVDMLSIKK
ncbi:MAG: Peptidyl-prolyl cis-trans isomerase [Parcubacteria group bacterium GW2011_GWA2_37_10]|nr:MAG: Peptidyl-prolyl cis-trans isomerase [Parcubacteria group bacterium GW2011_GWA2_37_10]